MLETPERNKLIEIVGGLYDFSSDSGPRGRRVLMQAANLSRFLSGIDLSGSARIVATDIITRSENFGPLPEEPTKHALGSLLSYILTLGDLGQSEKQFVAGLIVRYSLVADPVYIDDLRAKYSIADMVVRPPQSAQAAPPASKPVDAAPSFAVNIKDQKGLESVINSEDNFLDIYLLFGAIYSSQAVCRIEVPELTAQGTGFLIGPDLLLTNQHVLKNEDDVKDAVLRFDFRADATGAVPREGRLFKLQPDFYHYSIAEELDYALVRLQEPPLKEIAVQGKVDLSIMDLTLKGKHRGYLLLRPNNIREHERVNIIQHPDGDPMKVVMTQNYVVDDMSDSRVQYVADTMPGSSGSPVFNKNWEVVALHHSGTPYPPESVGGTLKKAWKGRFRVNEGVPIKAILKDFKAKNLERFLPRD